MSENQAQPEYFRHGRFMVTGNRIRARNRSMQLSTVEGVEVTRPLFLMALAGCVGFIGLSLVFWDLLYFGEIVLLLGLGVAVLAVSWHVGALKVFSKLQSKGWSVYWWIKPLQAMREAIERAMDDQTALRGRRRNQGGAVTEDGDDD